MMQMFEALPSYLGGKRRLVGAIFRHLPPASEAPVFADAFFGGGSVSLYAKARGYAVRCNDIAERSCTIGRALVSNDTVKLAKEDLASLFQATETDGFIRDRFAPDIVIERHAAFLDNAMAVARATPSARGDLLRLLLVRYLLLQRPMGNFGAKTIVHQLAAGDYDNIKPPYLKAAVQSTVIGHPWRHVQDLADKLNRGVFSNGHEHRVTQGDALDFVREVQALQDGQTPEWADSVDLLAPTTGRERLGFNDGEIGFLGVMLYGLTTIQEGSAEHKRMAKTCKAKAEKLFEMLQDRLKQVHLDMGKVGTTAAPTTEEAVAIDRYERQLAESLQGATEALRRAVTRRRPRDLGQAWVLGR